MAVLSMSKQEFSRLDVLLRVQSGRLRVADACGLMGLHRRQVFRLLRGLRQDGAPSLLSRRRGKPSNHRFSTEVRTLALSLVRERYADFGPTFAAEKLAEHHGCSVSHERIGLRAIFTDDLPICSFVPSQSPPNNQTGWLLAIGWSAALAHLQAKIRSKRGGFPRPKLR